MTLLQQGIQLPIRRKTTSYRKKQVVFKEKTPGEYNEKKNRVKN